MKILFRYILALMIISSPLKSVNATIYPPSLKEGDKVALVAPAGPVSHTYVEGAVEVLRDIGYEPVVYPTVHKTMGQFAGTAEERLEDMKKALTDTTVRAIICARGGYGAVHLLDSLAVLPLADDPKWVVGFSDITALHGLMASKGIASIHGPMALHLSRGLDEPENVIFFDILKGKFPEYTFAGDSRNHPGKATGKLLGGNLSVLEGLVGTPYDLVQPGTILFVEDVGEPVYKLQRIMYQLKLSGALDKLSGLIIGQFTKVPKGQNWNTAEPMLQEILTDYPDLPVAFNVPIGHIRRNIPLIESGNAIMEVTPDSVTLKFPN